MKKILPTVALLCTLGAMGFFAITLIHATTYAPEDVANTASVAFGTNIDTSTSTPTINTISTTTIAAIKIVHDNYPLRLIIPSISVDAHVQETTITKRGTMGTPTNFTDVAWYEYGAVPGDTGEAAIDGHVDNGLGLSGVFIHLDTIKIGTDIFITKENGTKVHFIVSNVTWYDYKSVPMTTILSTTGAPRLALITCGGTWVAGEKTYNQRLVVEAVLSD